MSCNKYREVRVHGGTGNMNVCMNVCKYIKVGFYQVGLQVVVRYREGGPRWRWWQGLHGGAQGPADRMRCSSSSTFATV